MIITAITITLFLITLLTFSKRPKHYPPGPSWIPIVGNDLQIKKLVKKHGGLHLALLEVSKQYNTDILGIKLGNELIVSVFSYPAIKAVLSSDDYNSRPTNFFMKLRCLGDIKGVTSTDGEIWNVQKSFVLKVFRNLGYGTETEKLMNEKAKEIIHDIEQNTIVVEKLISSSIISILWTIMTGSQLSKHDPKLIKLLNLLDNRLQLFDISGGILAHYPWMRFIAPEKVGYTAIQNVNTNLIQFFRDTIQEHHQTWTEGKDTDLMYSFITEMKKKDAHYSFTDDQLLMICMDIFIAAANITSCTLDFAFLMMLHHPDVQKKVHDILDAAPEQTEAIDYSDRQKYPYIEAVLLEVGRYCSVAPIIGPRRALKDMKLNGYVIPKDTTVLVHSHVINMSPQHWDEPDKFKPERFLDQEGNLANYDELLTFSLGKRKCMGESFARRFMFIYFAQILRTYSIEKEPGVETISTDRMIHSAKYNAKFIRRQKSYNC